MGALIAVYAVHSLQKRQARADMEQARVDAHPVRVLATDLWADSKSGPATMAAKYGGHVLEVTGHLTSAVSMMGGQQLLLFATGEGQSTLRATMRADAQPLDSDSSKQGAWVRLSCPTLTTAGGEPALEGCVTAEQAAAE